MAYQRFWTAGVAGGAGASSISMSTGDAFEGQGFGAGWGAASIEDAALLLYCAGIAGAVGASAMNEDLEFEVVTVGSACLAGCAARAVMFLDNDEDSFKRYLPAGDSR